MGRPREAGVVMLPKGVNRIVRRNGRVAYYWHPGRGTADAERLRGQWCRLPDDPESPAFWHAIEDAKAPPEKPLGGIARMVDEYQRSPRYLGLAEATRRDYDRYLVDFRRRFGDLEPKDIDPHHLAALRDSFGNTASKADHYVAVCRAIYAWGVERGHARTNPAIGISTIAKIVPYEPWPQWAWELVPQMRRELRVACFLALYTGQRLGDILRMQLGHVEDGRVKVRQSKTRKELVIKLHGHLRPILDECRANATIFLVSRQDGTPFTVDQFHAMWGREKQRQFMARFCAHRPAIVFHGLRKSAVCKLLEAGCTHKEVAAVTGHSLGQIEHYSRSADQLKLNEAAMRKMEA
jgi:integrase